MIFTDPHMLLPTPDRCALLVIDIQERLAAAMPSDILTAILRNTCILIETAREFHMPILVSEQYPKGLGPTVAEVRAALPADTTPIAKLAFSCCREEAFANLFAGRPGLDFILCGMETHVCVLQTALDLLQQGRRVYIAADAVCSRTRSNWSIGLDTMRQGGAVIGSTEMFAFGLLGAAGTEQFKRISKLVK
jgi:nicotinamidase-related amidase